MSTPERAGRSKWLLGTSLLAAGAAGLSYVANRSLRRWLDRPLLGLSGRLVLEGLRAPVEVIRDRWGVPHIYAADEADLFFAQGFIQAQDRLFQMDASRRLGAGRLSEIVGPPGLAVDRTARVFDWARAAEATIAGAGPESRAVMEAYAAGVNAFIEQGPLPPEFTLLAYRPEPWSPLASAQWSVVLAWGLSANWEMELLRALMLERLGPSGRPIWCQDTGRATARSCRQPMLVGDWRRS